MKTKTCSKCKIEKDVSEFYKDKQKKDGLHCWCKDCKNLYHQTHKKEELVYSRKYEQSHKQERINYNLLHKKEKKKYRTAHKEEAKEYSKKYRDSHKEELSKQKKKYYEENKDKILSKQKEHYQTHKEEINKRNKEYAKQHELKMKSYIKEYRRINKERINAHQTQRKKNDINFKIRGNLRTRICQALKRNTKALPTMFLIGCEVEYLMYHLQCKFTKDMTWDNHGRGVKSKKEWHIDHITPCSSFDLSKPEEQRKCFHYSNLQPLWAKDNRSKGNK